VLVSAAYGRTGLAVESPDNGGHPAAGFPDCPTIPGPMRPALDAPGGPSLAVGGEAAVVVVFSRPDPADAQPDVRRLCCATWRCGIPDAAITLLCATGATPSRRAQNWWDPTSSTATPSSATIRTASIIGGR
jgi:hypothetical protein